ncbi:MAG: DUF2797 domain-containing protein [Moheibacter sp.]
MIFEGQIRKMIAEYTNPVHYYLNLKDDFLDVNQQIGKKIRIIHDHNECLNCGLDHFIYRMGYCKTCFFTVPEANENIIRPELSKAHLGIGERDLEWEIKFQLQPHIVYLAVSSDIKVGVTRENHQITRWIDQGASYATVFAKTDNRYEAGLIEVEMKNYVSDKTGYQKMLRNDVPEIDLLQQKDIFKVYIPSEQSRFYVPDGPVYTFEYPVTAYPQKVKSLNLLKQKDYEGKLVGIKGQYWIFEDGTAWNVRGHEGFYVKLEL